MFSADGLPRARSASSSVNPRLSWLKASSALLYCPKRMAERASGEAS